jgi:hypothetical protein
MYFAIIASDKPFGVHVSQNQSPRDPVFEVPGEVVPSFGEGPIDTGPLTGLRQKAAVRIQAVINAAEADRTKTGDAIFMVGNQGDNIVAKLRE